MDGMFSLPAGHVDEGETLTQCLIREIREEVGVTVKPRDTKLVHVMHRRETDERVDFFFAVSAWEGEPFNTEPDRCGELRWVQIDDLPDTTIPYIRAAIEAWQKGEWYSERGWT